MRWLAPATAILLSLEAEASRNTYHESPLLCFVNQCAPYSVSHSYSTDPAMLLLSKNSYADVIESRERNVCFKQSARFDTSLSMGIRSMFGLGKKTKEDDEKERSQPPQDIKAALEAIKADLEAVTEEQESSFSKESSKKEIPEEMKDKTAEVKKSGILNSLGRSRQEKAEPAPTSATTYGESVRDRINRVKSGKMTDEEKAAFLRTALTRTPQVPKGPRIRQEIPSASGVARNASSSASPVRKDALWNTVIGNKTSSSSSRSKYGGYKGVNLTGKDDSAKREYLDMVTNPDRFKSYAAMGGYKSSSTGTENDDMEALNMTSSVASDVQGEALASRLESAAILKEQQDAQARIQREEAEQAQKERMLEEKQKREAEIRKREEEKLAAKRAEQERIQREVEERREAEKKRLADLQAAQDEYWRKKLEEEKRRKERSMSAEEKAYMEEKRRQEAAAKLAASARQAAKQAEIEMLREEERAREDPHEAEILKEAAEDELHERERNADIMEQSAAYVSRTMPQQRPNDVSSKSFLEEQEKKKAALDDFMKQQNERLASLSSPLPFLGSKKSKFEQTPPKSQGVMPSLNLTDLTMRKNQNNVDKSTDVRSESKSQSGNPQSRLSLADLTMAKKSEPNENPLVSTTDGVSEVKIPSLAEMTMLKKTQSDGVPPSTPTRRPAPTKPSSSSRPIRQSIPIAKDDDEDDDFFEYSRNGGNSGMSIKEIMARQNGNSASSSSTSKSDAAKQQSKMWGIDIDKFLD